MDVPVTLFNWEDLWDLFSRVTQSNNNFKIDDSFKICVTYIPLVNGKRNKNNNSNLKTGSILCINDNDNLCLPRVLVCGEVDANKNNSLEWKTSWKKIKLMSEQKGRANILLEKCKIKLNENDGCGIHELQLFQQYFSKMNICLPVFGYETFGTGAPLLFDGRETFPGEYSTFINIMYYEEEQYFNLIINLLAAKSRMFYCTPCNISYSCVLAHKCDNICPQCNGPQNCEKIAKMLKKYIATIAIVSFMVKIVLTTIQKYQRHVKKN